MKSFLTFTLAAGVAITTTSIAQAEGVSNKGRANNLDVGAKNVAPSAITLRAPLLDRTALNRELSRLTFEPQQTEDEDSGMTATVTRKSVGTWTY